MSLRNRDTNWKTQAYVIGAALGLIYGIASAWMYARAVENDPDHEGPRIQTGEVLTVGLAALAMMRQIAEMGKPEKKRR